MAIPCRRNAPIVETLPVSGLPVGPCPADIECAAAVPPGLFEPLPAGLPDAFEGNCWPA